MTFPQVLATGVVRKVIECFFTQKELRWLDDLLPGAGKKKESEKVFEILQLIAILKKNMQLNCSKLLDFQYPNAILFFTNDRSW
jgi:hypothetical protein